MNSRLILPLLLALAAFLFASPVFAADGTTEFAAAVDQGLIYAIGVALLGGLGVAGTGCVYPMIAITVSVFGARQSESKLHGLGLSSMFVLGIATMFTPLGVVAGMTGTLFGSVLQNQWVLVGISLVFLAMAASMFGAFELALPSALTNKLAQMGGIGPRGAFVLGLVTGLIAAPCTGPVLTGILAWIAETQNALLGAEVMAAFSFGLGFPFLIVGTFAVQLPKSGRWMLHIKSLFGLVMATVALYYLGTAFPELGSWVKPNATTYGAAGLVLLVGLALGAVHRDFHSPLIEDKIYKSVGTTLATGAAFVLVTALATPERSLDWLKVPYEDARATAKQEKRPLLVDFSAAWCGACKELDKVTFANPEVSQEAGRFVAVKIDATNDEDPIVQATMEQLGVVGLPTIVLFNSEGEEVRRFTDFVEPHAFLAAIEGVD